STESVTRVACRRPARSGWAPARPNSTEPTTETPTASPTCSAVDKHPTGQAGPVGRQRAQHVSDDRAQHHGPAETDDGQRRRDANRGEGVVSGGHDRGEPGQSGGEHKTALTASSPSLIFPLGRFHCTVE